MWSLYLDESCNIDVCLERNTVFFHTPYSPERKEIKYLAITTIIQFALYGVGTNYSARHELVLRRQPPIYYRTFRLASKITPLQTKTNISHPKTCTIK